MNFANKKVVVLGVGISGNAVARVAKELGATVILSDANEQIAQKYDLDTLKKCGIQVELGAQDEALVTNIDYLILSPGVPISVPLVQRAIEKGVEVISEIEVAYRLCKVPMYAITGTNGKTTTTTLLGEFMKKTGKKVGVGGNIGVALSSEVHRVGAEGCIVAEISSYQLEASIDFNPHIVSILNVTPDHIARHGSLENYQKMKEKIFSHHTKDDYLVLNYDDDKVRDMAKRAKSTVMFFSRLRELNEGAFVKNNELMIVWQGKSYKICSVDDVKIKGGHNIENALAAAGVAFLAGVDVQSMAEVLKEFSGVEHRIEPVTTIHGVPYFNDSKATNPESSIKALEAFDGHIILIAGGHDKNTDLTEFMQLVKKKVDALILIGNAAARFKEAAIANEFHNIYETGYSMEEAVKLANQLANHPQVVLLSPACASYDMFDGFEERGRAFKELVYKLK
ncbi:UDP-N-acetylmuramoyl-L-alanine--D-glutamate ligase [Anaerosinus massiliensis]|uniref:UDP-N-acetylmuramoyl-L-alanine--D-glutamate ligase n=1 Tax=Massilibacillus massiliensis TaxID=1806837 RepID=UPI000AFFDC24|nr:UDP-N-acetylmuramoyl-L-alanine--D-glutamate ligase [Massilibacillus massiliensis]